ncbi:MAG: alpha/beta hydrolase fold domain-containing protein [Candidatus Omnitrophica bacterium]|nr:alpha/beta hydrolase fold domain-containing protein [Candidatus Omnitrophota bacterium]MBU4478534.1 alpha/beta hydrolase fold domain-containing protein [Candidatus Omnitrophota bacterium]MCG2702869.1 alpha/beta hydrolase fold domain-containing protein [Candidatus Omnitrophota bacterium]
MRKKVQLAIFIFSAILLANSVVCFSADLPSDYDLFIPENLSAGKNLPLLICLPAIGDNRSDEIENWKLPAAKHGFVVICPKLDYGKIKKIADVKSLNHRIKKIVKEVSSEYSIDPKRVFIAGTSAGGMFAISLTLLSPEQYGATGVIRGARLNFVTAQSLENAWKCRFYLVHGQGDSFIPIKEYYDTKWQLKKRGAFIEENVDPGYKPLSEPEYEEVTAWFAKL